MFTYYSNVSVYYTNIVRYSFNSLSFVCHKPILIPIFYRTWDWNCIVCVIIYWINSKKWRVSISLYCQIVSARIVVSSKKGWNEVSWQTSIAIWEIETLTRFYAALHVTLYLQPNIFSAHRSSELSQKPFRESTRFVNSHWVIAVGLIKWCCVTNFTSQTNYFADNYSGGLRDVC